MAVSGEGEAFGEEAPGGVVLVVEDFQASIDHRQLSCQLVLFFLE
ncbi:hypothetical protein [Cellulomonas flavigena]|nr:hypothetical protein [Cellulomonas flavigena]